MKQLRPINGDHGQYHDDIAESKYGESLITLRAIKPRLHAAFSDYKSRYDNDTLAGVASLDLNTTEVNSCKQCYDSITKQLEDLIIKIYSSQELDLQGVCQYCCINGPKTMDHYLPQSAFPEFSVYALNLIPCCGECNNKKRVFWRSNDERAIFHFYKDTPPVEVFLFSELKYNGRDEVPTVEFIPRWDNISDARLRHLARNHYEKLDLLSRYHAESRRVVTANFNSLRNHSRLASLETRSQNLRNEATGLRRIFGMNYWVAAILDGMAGSDRFLRSVDG